MTVYVDDAFIETPPGYLTRRRALWCHLTADTQAELHEFAESIGLQRRWFQDPLAPSNAPKRLRPAPGSRAADNWHYDVTKTLRAKAIRAGALPVTQRQLVAIITQRWETAHARHFDATGHCGGCGQPGDFCLCTKGRPCRCNDRHEMGSGVGKSAADVFADGPVAIDDEQLGFEIEQASLF